MTANDRVNWLYERMRQVMKDDVPEERIRMFAESAFRAGLTAGADAGDSWGMIADVVIGLWSDALLNEWGFIVR